MSKPMNSDLILPPGIALPPGMQPQEAPDEAVTDIEKGTYLPAPCGYKLLCALPEVKETFEGSDIVRPEAFARQEEHATAVLFVLAVGSEAYKDEKKFPNGPWCKAGDFVMVRTYSGTRFKIFGKEMRLINDDMVEAVVADPRGITRA
jgi:co-chaperonin GroES (HSP10)